MAPRSSWKGYIRLSLVSVPVKAYTVSSASESITLHQLHAVCNNRIRYQKTCPEHGEVPAEEIVKGYEYAKGQYVVIDPEEIEKLRPEKDQSVQIQGFIDPREVDPVYHAGKDYYLVPDGAVGQKPYALLMRGMAENNLHAIAQVVISGREQLALLRPDGEIMVLSVLHHEAEVKSSASFKDEIAATELLEEEVRLTNTLIGATTLRDFDLGAYKDTYTERLTQLIQLKIEGKEVVEVPSPEEPRIINLMEALKRSVAAAQGAQEESQPAGGKMAPSARARGQKKKSAGKKKVG